MARTRSKPSAKDKKKESTPEPIILNAKPLPPSDANPPKLFVLPKDTSKDARIVTLDNPANGSPSRYFFCPQKGFHEFTRISAPRKECNSWLITPDTSSDGHEEKEEDVAVGQQGVTLESGYSTKAADLFIATPIDLLFLILPALAPKSTKETKQHFLSLDDHLDALESISRQWRVLLAQYPTLREMIEKRMGVVCDTVTAGDETMYRISQDKLLAVLFKKAERMRKNGLPPSLEEKFVKTVLEVPVMSIKREDSSVSVATETPTSQPSDSQTSTSTPSANVDSQPSTTPSTDSQSSTESTSTAATTISTTDTKQPPTLTTPPTIPPLLRLRTSLTYLSASYLPPSLLTPLTTTLSTHPCFAPLTAHLSALSALRAEAAALRSISDNISRKRGYEDDDDEKVAEREEKKRRKEEEERKKKGESRAVKQLNKVDTSGMKKMSAFFAKAPKKA